jgi:hypothetical protein
VRSSTAWIAAVFGSAGGGAGSIGAAESIAASA